MTADTINIEDLEPYEQIDAIARHRESELRPMFSPAVALTDAYGRVLAQAAMILGAQAPASPHDATLRDLFADTYDFLYEWRRPLLEGRAHMAYPVGRRAYESLSLFAATSQDANLAAKWERGREIKNEEIRKALAASPIPESEGDLSELYKFFSLGAHPNRVLVANRHLGDGNEFVLGPIGKPSMTLTVEHLSQLVSCWFWFGAVVSMTWKEALIVRGSSYADAYFAAAKEVGTVRDWLHENLKHVVKEEQQLMRSR